MKTRLEDINSHGFSSYLQVFFLKLGVYSKNRSNKIRLFLFAFVFVYPTVETEVMNMISLNQR